MVELSETFELEMRLTMTKHKHLTLSDRNDIQLGLERSETFKAIGQSILKTRLLFLKKSNETDKSESLHAITFLASTRQSSLCL